MRKITKPNYDPKNVYLTCISKVQDSELKERLENIADHIATAANEYDRLGKESQIYRISEDDNIAGVSQTEMEKVYSYRMVNRKQPGRSFYDEIRASATLGICPLCGQRAVSQLDHYLPKTKYLSLVVVPFNLVPACSDCNKIKLTVIPQSAESQTLHPYYDDVTNEQWLFAEVIQSVPAAIRYCVRIPNSWDGILGARVQYHFNKLELDDLYRSQAAAELADIRSHLISLFDKTGEVQVQAHLNDCAVSRYQSQINSWKTAMYQALANNKWFCQGGFRLV